MLAALTDEQEALREVAQRVAESGAVQNPRDAGTVDRAGVWTRLAEAGLLGLRAREDGAPLASGTEVSLVAEALGAHLVPVPFVGVSLAVELLALAGADKLVDEVSEGATRIGIALDQSLAGLATTADSDVVTWDADGVDSVVALGASSGGSIEVVRATVDSSAATPSGVDVTRSIARSSLAGAEVVGSVSADQLVRWKALALTLVSADAVGAMRHTLNNAIAYSKERVAYGVPIGSFQALQHIMADAYVKSEPASALMNYAAWAVDVLEAPEALVAGQSAKAYSSLVGTEVGEVAMQVFGGIGQTREHIAHYYTRRLIVDRQLFGAESVQLAAIADARLAVA